jgi:N-acetylated-alpha-linked acidic dipeptidase
MSLDFLVLKLTQHVIKPLDIHFELSPLASAIAKLRTLAMRLSENEEISRNSDAKDQVNLLFRQGERYFLSQKGLPGRKWFKHVVQAPGINLGYGSEVFPGLQEAIRAKDLDLAKSQRDEIADLIFSLAEQFGQFVSSSRE